MTDERRPKQEGDVLGISDADPDVEIPRATDDRGGHPKGIDVRRRAPGIGDVQQGKGATGMDMGAGGGDTYITSDSERPRSTEDRDE
jgi:hypothetical protein